ncbi:hypothetical protein DFH09DRAFT_1326270 [Mycena vulgaris]|nr:hypothetical protein DFH09DRAFT_1326270 [Mycena vulgaris]
MASRSLAAVYMMLSIVESVQREGSLDLTLEQVRRQFETEYRVSTTEAARRAANEIAPPTAQELEEKWFYLQQRMAHEASLGTTRDTAIIQSPLVGDIEGIAFNDIANGRCIPSLLLR